MDYDTWKTEPEDYYESSQYSRLQTVEKLEKDILRIEEYMKGVVELLYGTERLDSGQLEFCLDEICAVLDIDLPESMPTVERKRSDIFNLTLDIIKFNDYQTKLGVL